MTIMKISQVTTQTLDPFSGVLYVQPSSAIRRGEQGPAHCRAEGRGRHEVSLGVRPGQCGWRREGGRVSLELYMQYDPHVQQVMMMMIMMIVMIVMMIMMQVIDERLVLECDMASRVGTVRDLGLGSLEAVQNTASIPLTASIGGPGSGWASAEDIKEDIEDIVIGETDPEDVDSNQISESVSERRRLDDNRSERRRLDDNRSERRRFDDNRRRRLDDLESAGVVTGWLDISQEGGRIQDPLQEGQVVRLSAKVQQSQVQDTLLTRCMLATEAGDLVELTDEFGCSLDRGLVSDFRSEVNEITGVKETVARLTVPAMKELGARVESVRIKCSLAVCARDCPIITCDRSNQPISVQDSVVLETRALFARKEIMNSVEEVEHEIREDHYTDTVTVRDVNDDEVTLCLSPTRLVLAFGVLITVIIASLLLSCYLWMRQDEYFARKKRRKNRQFEEKIV